MSIKKIAKYDKQDINNVGVVSLAIRPNQPSQYGVGSLTGKQLQERFDKLATTAIDKINAVIDVLNSEDVAEYLSLGKAFSADKSIKDMIADIYSATDGLVTTDPETAAKKAVKDILEDFYNGIIDLEAFTEISNFDEGKTLSEIYATQDALSAHNESAEAHTAAITAHNTATDAHSDIRNSIPAAITAHNTADGTHTDIRNSIPAAITAHNTADGTHTDIRNSIPAAITAHNTATDAHAALRESITDAATAAVGTGISNHNEDENAHSDIRTALTNLKTAVEHFLNIKDKDSLDQLSEIITYIENNKTLIDGITTSKVNVADIVNNLESTAENQPLSAQMGKTLNDNKLDKFVNDSRVSKVYGVGPKNDPKQQMFISKSGFEGDEAYDSVPLRSAYNNAKHPGTFEIEHPIMVTNSTAYSEKHPVTVKVLKDYVSENGSGGSACSCTEATSTKAGLMSASDKQKLDMIPSGSNVTVPEATSTSAGLMSASDKQKLDGIADEATKNTATATATQDGLMSALDKRKLDGIAENATKNTSTATTTQDGLMSALDKRKLDGLSSSSLYNNSVVITGRFYNDDRNERNIKLSITMNIYTTSEKNYNILSSFLSDMATCSGMSFVISGILTYTEGVPTPTVCHPLRLRYYDNKLQVEYYDPTENEYLWTKEIQNNITISSISKSV